MSSRVVIVGAGHAGFHAALFLRSRAWDGEVVLVDSQDRLPYQRPPLSKEFLAGKQELVDAEFRPASFYAERGIELVTGHAVTAIARTARAVEFADRDPVSYDVLVLATGSRPRPLPVPGAGLDGVLHLAVAPDAEALRTRIGNAGNVVVVGGGFIGLETAAMAAAAGRNVTVFEACDRLMARVVSEPMSRYFEELHRAHGVEIALSSVVAAIEGEGQRVRAVLTADGTAHPADVVVVGIGALPNDTLAAEAGIATDDGIVVGPDLRTTDEHVFAIGDCARWATYHGNGAAVRLESVQNATDQGRFLASLLHGGAGAAYDAVPWFWTEQFGRKLQIAGLLEGVDRVERVATTDDKFSINCYRGDVLVARESVDSPRDHVTARKQLAAAGPRAGRLIQRS